MTRRGFLAGLLALAGTLALARPGRSAPQRRILVEEAGLPLITESGELLGWA